MDVVAHVVEEEVAEVEEEVIVDEVVAASSRESALPKFQQRPPNGAREGVVVGDVAAAEWSAGVAHEAVDGLLPKSQSLLLSLSLLLFFLFYNILVAVKLNSTAPPTARPAEHASLPPSNPPLNPHANRETYSGPWEEICRLPLENNSHVQSI